MPGGAPSDLTAARSQAVIDAIRTGAPERRAAAFAGVHLDTIKAWRRRGEAALAKSPSQRGESGRRYAEFVLNLDKALAETAILAETVISSIMRDGIERMNDQGQVTHDPTIEERRLALDAAKFHLTHRDKENYSLRSEHTGKEGGPIELSGDDALRMVRDLAAKMPPPSEDEG